MDIKLINIIIFFLFGFALNKNLRSLDEPVKFDELLGKIPNLYNKFVESFYDDSPYKGKITLYYIKDAESTGQKKVYLNKREKELLIVAREVVEAIRAIDGENVLGSHYNLLFSDISTNLKDQIKSNYYDLKWYSYFLEQLKFQKKVKLDMGFYFL